jgi:phospholipid-transporting ATPase
VAYESWTLSLYNVVFTVLPPLIIGIFDQFVSARILDRYPQLYMLGQRNVFFTKTAFWMWVANALFHSLVSIRIRWVLLVPSNIYTGCVRLLDHSVVGRPQVIQWT